MEAAERMKLLGLNSAVINDFLDKGMIYRSDSGESLYWLTAEEKSALAVFSTNHHDLVYHVIRTQTKIGIIYTYLTVSEETSLWERDRKDLTAGIAYAYTDSPDEDIKDVMSGFGNISFEIKDGVLTRTE